MTRGSEEAGVVRIWSCGVADGLPVARTRRAHRPCHGVWTVEVDMDGTHHMFDEMPLRLEGGRWTGCYDLI
ncbi:unnamed protein product [Urochloa humidicola]